MLTRRLSSGRAGHEVLLSVFPAMAPGAPWFPSRDMLRGRELGAGSGSFGSFVTAVSRRRGDAAVLSGDKTFAHGWSGGVNCLELDESDRRYLLVGSVDAVIAAYDTEHPAAVDPVTGNARHGRETRPMPPETENENKTKTPRGVPTSQIRRARSVHPRRVRGWGGRSCRVEWCDPPLRCTSPRSATLPTEPLFRISKGGDTANAACPRAGHLFSVSCAAWYPVDTGMFFTGSFDCTVAGWDTNTQQRVCTFEIPAKVYAVSMAPRATSHCLVAVGSGSPQVRLCDPVSGNVTHTLTGHREGVWATRWSRGSEYVLMTGGCEGDVRLWDIRRAGAFMALDASNACQPDLDPLEQATTFPVEGPIPAGPAPVSRKRADAVPVHLWSDDAVRCRSAGYGSGARAGAGRERYRGGTYGDHSYGAGGGSGGGGWGMGFRRRPGDGSRGGGGTRAGEPGGRNEHVTTPEMVPPTSVWSQGAAVPVGRAHAGRVTALSCTPDGLFLVSAGTDHRLRLWDLSTGRNRNAAYGEAPNDSRKGTTIGISPDGSRLYHPSSDGNVLVFDTHASARWTAPAASGGDTAGTTGAVGDGGDDEDGAGRRGGDIRRGRVDTLGSAGGARKLRRVVRRGGRSGPSAGDDGRRPFATLKGHLSAVCACVVHPDTQEIYTGGLDRHLLVWRPSPPARDTPPSVARGVSGAADGVYRPFQPSAAERRNRAGPVVADVDDWSDDEDEDGGRENGGIDPDPGARAGIHGLGYRRGFNQ